MAANRLPICSILSAFLSMLIFGFFHHRISLVYELVSIVYRDQLPPTLAHTSINEAMYSEQ